MKFKGQISQRGENKELILVTRVGEFYLDSMPPYCIPTENILKAANFPKKKNFKIELVPNENGLLVFKDETAKRFSGSGQMDWMEYNPAGYFFNHMCIAKWDDTKSDDTIILKKLRSSGVIETKINAYDLLINGILINGFEYELSEHYLNMNLVAKEIGKAIKEITI